MARNSRDDRSRVPEWITPMLAAPGGPTLASGPQWTYEAKLDGFRTCMRIAPNGDTVLTSRNGLDFTAEFADLAGVVAEGLEGRAAVLDGEIVVYDEHGRIDFDALQDRRGRYRKHATRRPGQPFEDPVEVRFMAFDLLLLGENMVVRKPYRQRRALLEQVPMPDPYRVSVVKAFPFDTLTADRLTPQALLDRVTAAGFEGLMAKLATAPYVPGQRSDAWLKFPATKVQDVLVCGWRPGKGRFTGLFGGLLLGAHDPGTGNLVYIGDVGTGFSEAARRDLHARLEALERRRHPFANEPPREDVRGARWVEPLVVGEVRYRRFTTSGEPRLRHASWRGIREDITPSDVILPRPHPTPRPPREAVPADPQPEPVEGERVTVRVGTRHLALSNLDKVLYPVDGLTKAEVIEYYTRIAPVLLPHLSGRPITMIRFPNGVGGQQFFAKNVPKGAPSWLSTVRLPHRSSRAEGKDTIDYPLIEDLPALVWAANLAALELHVPQWTVGPGPVRLPPDRLVFDLDPGEGTSIVECARVAERLHSILTAHGLTPVAKTSGSKGLQVYAGITTTDPAEPSAYAKALAQQLARETPDLVVAKMAKAVRPGKVFIDWSQNNPAKTTVAPYSLRGRDHPTVSTPITWAEVRGCRRVRDLVFTAVDVIDRVEDIGDLFAALADTRASLPTR
ncbi:DNA ligase D [Allokutzneria albata]|uniref:DNA ligase (ATP) n=1 Tax=Allokutzneria albata TaxID=211114 RepID=A0A1G9SDI9_ALLAB|nr:DNA ligase D [Allokutzneria albata]SDM33543.1 ATP-dependent DNA ligase LigD phosphoesterase module /ATP-dependent DNA ligase LigD polymerase module [Allokutzneria albata]